MTVRRIAEKIRKKAARGLALGLCLGLLSAGRLTSYADGPSGPASDGAAVAAESAKEAQAEGPAQNMETESAGQAETGGQPEGTSQETSRLRQKGRTAQRIRRPVQKTRAQVEKDRP